MCNVVARLTASETQIDRFGDLKEVKLVKTAGFEVLRGRTRNFVAFTPGWAGGLRHFRAGRGAPVAYRPRGGSLQLCCVTAREVTKTVGFGGRRERPAAKLRIGAWLRLGNGTFRAGHKVPVA